MSSKVILVAGTADLNGQAVNVASNYEFKVMSTGTLTNSKTKVGTLNLTGSNTKLNVFGALTNTGTDKVVINCKGTSSTDMGAGMFLKAGSTMSNTGKALGFDINVSGAGSCLSVETSIDLSLALGSVTINSTASGTVLNIAQGVTFALGTVNFL